MHRKFWPLFLLVSVMLFADELPVELNGLSGAKLRSAIADKFAPVHITAGVVDLKGGVNPLKYFDTFSASTVDASTWTQSGVVPSSWFLYYMPDDMYNLLLIDDVTAENRRDFPVGDVDNVTFTNGVWKSGTTDVYGFPIEFYSPPAEYRGDFARIMFYYVTVYSPSALAPRGYTMLDASAYPALSDYGIRILMKYHRDDPPSADELNRNSVISSRQGNRNPFVDYPLLAEYLWGDKAGERIDIPDTPAPLRGTYYIDEQRIDLVSEYVPEGAIWSVDGRRINGYQISPASVGLGMHTLRYDTADGRSGLLTIKILNR